MTATTTAPATFHSNAATNSRALSPVHWHDSCGMQIGGEQRSAALAPIAAAFNRGGAAEVIKAASGGRDSYVSRAWALAMTAEHGRTGTVEAMQNHPLVLKAKAEALAALVTHLSV